MGAFTPTTRELDSATVQRSRFLVDPRESKLNEAGESLIPKSEGLIGDDHIVGEIGEVLLDQAPGRQTPEEITVFKSLGIAVEDLASAHHVLKRAHETGTGIWVEIGGRHFGSI